MTDKKQSLSKFLGESKMSRWGQLAKIPTKLTESFIKKENLDEEEELDEDKKGLDEDKEVAKEGKSLSQSPIKQGGNKTLAEGEDEEMPPEAPVGQAPPEAPKPEMPGAGGNEAMIQDLVKAIADAITQKTGVAVDVQGSAGGEGGEMPPTDEMPPSNDVPSEEPPVMETGSKRTEDSKPPDRKLDMAREGKQELKEEFAEAPKKTMPNKPGEPKDPYKSQVKVDGVEKPDAYLGKTNNSYPHHMKIAENQLAQRVLEGLLKEFKKAKKK